MRFVALALMSCAAPLAAQDFLLDMPIDCTLDEDCYIQNYVDRDPTDAATDFMCGGLTYDTHKGTDFALHTLADLAAGVDVLAAASGTVRGIRNDMRDVLYTSDLDQEINGRDCGNGVVIAHGNGWETQYCHLKEGSVQVRAGDVLEAGDVLGQVGLSGRTQFPHVHVSVRRDGQTIDPFDPNDTATCNAPSETTLWRDDLSAQQGGLITVGFAEGVPDYDAVKAGTAAANTLSANMPIVLWALAFGARPGDVIELRFDGPNGPLFETMDVLNRQQSLVMRAGGLNTPDQGWAVGRYMGEVRHLRDGILLDQQSITIDLP